MPTNRIPTRAACAERRSLKDCERCLERYEEPARIFAQIVLRRLTPEQAASAVEEFELIEAQNPGWRLPAPA